MYSIPFNKPYLSGNELNYIQQSVQSGKISGDGVFTKKCHAFFAETFGFNHALLTTSCTDALEMSAILAKIQAGDEVIAPSYTFVSTINPFILRGAKIIFADSNSYNPNIDENSIEALITPRTKAIVVVHYAGIACNMDAIMELANKHKLIVIEDAAQAIDSYYKQKPLGSIGHMAAFSFHETKNIIAGEGGLLVLNDAAYYQRAEVIREKGTNRSQFFRGEIDKYGWVDVGSSFLPSDIIAAYLYAQLENINTIQAQRIALWNNYHTQLQSLNEQGIQLPHLPEYASNNGHMYYIVTTNEQQRNGLLQHLKSKGIYATFHYQSLHASTYFAPEYKGGELPQADRYSNCLVRLPLYYELSDGQQALVIESVLAYLA